MAANQGARWGLPLVLLAALGAVLGGGSAMAGRISDVTNTKHNLSISGPGSVKAFYSNDPSWGGTASQGQVCVYCHTPHGATIGASPLWNRKLLNTNYTRYTSSSMDADVIQTTLNQPAGSSKLCLSCHDGTMAVGNVNVMSGFGNSSTSLVGSIMLGTEEWDSTSFMDGKMPYGGAGAVSGVSGVSSGYTRRLGTNLSNDHPISVTYSTALSDRDGELRSVDSNQKYPAGTGEIIRPRGSGFPPKVPLENTGLDAGVKGQIQCSACHDPHLRETDATLGNAKFLRLNRFQAAAATTTYSDVNDIGCVACHDKDKGSGAWVYSVHANDQVATQNYSTSAANRNEFPTTADGLAANLPVWKASCLNCHDTHAVQGSRQLLREGTDSTSTPKVGGNSAIEETCYQCHTSPDTSAISGVDPVQDIKSDFARTRHMPITSSEQTAGSEVHDISANFNDTGFVDCTIAGPSPSNLCGADMIERQSKLGLGNLNNRHAECTDCHNPHRAVKFNSLVGNGGLSGSGDSTGTHKHNASDGDYNTYTHTNLASGALRGTFGVEPAYSANDFFSMPSDYTVKRGDPWTSTNTNVSAAYVTREYQICLKCHSDYGYTDNNNYEADRPRLPLTSGGNLTDRGINGLDYYTNQAREFQAPSTHRGEPKATDSGAAAAYANGTTQTNYRSWHPVMDITGRSGVSAATFTLPWSNAVGSQTMYCSDCHGPEVSSATSVIPDNPVATQRNWGPHGSSNDFILKGTWSDATGPGYAAGGLCFKCHAYDSYALGTAAASAVGASATGFWLTDVNMDGHQRHVDKIGGGGSRCTLCHVAVPHGWKNKGMLVNLNDVGEEGGFGIGGTSEVRANTTARYDKAPYYYNAMLKVINFKPSGQWTAADCGSANNGGNGQSGVPWMKTSNENCATPP